jgi:hypothetical protein
MAIVRPFALMLCSAFVLSACASHADNVSPKPAGAAADMHQPVPLASATPDSLIEQSYDASPNADSTGTAVGQKVQQLRGELDSLDSSVKTEASSLQALRASTQTNAADYYTSIAAINAKLQVGTTTGNPILVAQWTQAQAKLDNLNTDVGNLNALSNKIAASASQAAYILEAVRATYGLSGAVDEDHVNLASLEDNVNLTVVLIDRLLNEISGDLNRQSTYVAAERRNLQTLSLAINNGEMYGASLANRPYMTAFGDAGKGNVHESGRPLVVIRFDRQNVNYQHAVYQAVSQALDRYPQAAFDVVAVSPTGSNAAEGALATEDAKRNADGVARTMNQMGLPSNRITMSAATSSDATTTEVRIYVH